MKRPSFQFYPGDWTGNSNLRRCTHAEKGVWLEVMCLMHDQEEYGVLRWPLKELAQAVGCSVPMLKALVTKGVIKGDDKNLEEPYVYTPRSGRKLGDPVTLLDIQAGPIWYSSRMVKDEYVRANAGASTRFGAENKADNPPTRKPNPDSDRAKLRVRVLEKTGGNCYHCSTRLGDRWEIDHLMPRSKGGRHTFANLVPSCVTCNQDKSDTLPDDWAALSHSPNNAPSRSPSHRQGEGKGDGSSSSSSSSTSLKDKTTLSGSPDEAPENPNRETAKSILEYLNLKTGKSYRPVDANLDLITARLKDGVTEVQCQAVINAKVSDWADDHKMAEYLRPATLFNRTRFEQYIGGISSGSGPDDEYAGAI